MTGPLTLDILTPASATLELRWGPTAAEARPATVDDLNQLGYVDRQVIDRRAHNALLALVGIADSDDLSDAGSMIRYLAECAINYQHQAYPPDELEQLAQWALTGTDVPEERASDVEALKLLRSALAKPPGERRYPPEEPY